MNESEYFAPRGWVCAKCGSVMSPNQPFCMFCNVGGNQPTTLTCGNSSGDYVQLVNRSISQEENN